MTTMPGASKGKAKLNAYMLLRVRPRSEAEIRRRLADKGYAAGVIDEVVVELKREKQIDDAKFAKFLVESRMHSRPVGDVVLKHELREKGVSDGIIDAALAEKDAGHDEYALALEMARERFVRLKGIEPRKATKRVYDLLIRRGFKYDAVRRVIEEITKQDL